MSKPEQERLSSRSAFAAHYGAVLKRQGWLIVVIVVCAVSGAVAITAVQTSVYQASMKIVVGQGNGFFQPQFGSSVQPFTQTMTSLLESDIVARRVIQSQRLPLTPKGLLSELRVGSNPESSVLDVSYDSTDKKIAVGVLDAIGRIFTGLVKQRFGSQPGNAGTHITATVFDPAHLEPGTVAPHPARNAVLAAILGLLLGATAAFVRDSLDERVRSRKDAEAWMNAPVVGVIPQLPSTGRRPGHARRQHLAGNHAMLEALYMLRANLEFSEVGAAGQVIVVASAVPNEGKSTLAASLSAVLALSGKDVICVDADLRRPKLAEYLGQPQAGKGLVEVLADNAKLADVVANVTLPYYPRSGMLPAIGATVAARWASGNTGSAEGGQLRIVRHGSIPAKPADIFQSGTVEKIVHDLRGMADHVVFDTSPILLAADAFPLIRSADTLLVTVREGVTKREAAESAAATLDSLGVRDRLVVLNGSSTRESYGYYGYERPQPQSRPFRIVESTNAEGETLP